MPLQLSFTKAIHVDDPDVYFNSSCWGGDKISDRLLPMIRGRYTKVQHDQEDWGWFIWFADGPCKLAVDVYCDDDDAGRYRVILTSRVKPSLFGYRVIDTEQLTRLKENVAREFRGWVDGDIEETRLDEHHEPTAS